MTDVFILISRYIFLVLILVFLIQGIVMTLAQKRAVNPHMAVQASVSQRAVIIITHVLAFSILAFGKGDVWVWDTALQVAALSLLFFAAVFTVTGVFYKKNSLIINCVLYLIDISLILITRIEPELAMRQFIWIAAGSGAFAVIYIFLKAIPKTDALSLLYLIAGGVLLASPFLFGVTKGGASNWVSVPVFSYEVSFQPSEAVKFLFVFYLASVFRKEIKLTGIILPAAASMLFVLVLVYQRDLGGALIFFITFVTVAYIASNKIWLAAAAFAAFVPACAAAYNNFSHIRVRVEAWIDPWRDIAQGGYQIAQSLFAAGTWGPFGCGLTRGLPGYIPAVSSDFVFSAICEEFGVFFALALVGIYILIFYEGTRGAANAGEKYRSVLSSGFTVMLCFQTLLIIGGNMRALPLTGVTLPFISYGGSSVMVSLAMVSVIAWVSGTGDAYAA